VSDVTTIRTDSTAGSPPTIAVCAAAVTDRRVGLGMPTSIAADQAYYWSLAWQRDIRESLEALRAGEFEDFNDSNDPNDVIRWFLAGDDE
jgi:hypothetical protein